MFDQAQIGRHRWQALINGIVIGLGVGTLAEGWGILFIAVGGGMEYWHRQRRKRGQ